MANNVFDPNKHYKVYLSGIKINTNGFWSTPTVTGHFKADTVEYEYAPPGTTREFAVFVVDEPENHDYDHRPDHLYHQLSYPNFQFNPLYVGTYRIPMSYLKNCPPKEIE